jgi:hypothetical protein
MRMSLFRFLAGAAFLAATFMSSGAVTQAFSCMEQMMFCIDMGCAPGEPECGQTWCHVPCTCQSTMSYLPCD